MRTILFVDDCCNKPYDSQTLKSEALGGTEATIIRVAEGLARTGLFRVVVEQHNRAEQSASIPVYYRPPRSTDYAEYVISLRAPETLIRAKERFPNAKHYLWNHDLMVPYTAQALVPLSGFEAIAVSNFHKSQMVDVLRPQGYTGQFPVKVVYNPIDDSLEPDGTPVDRNKLVFFSSPHKGLDYALEVFSNLRRFNPDFTLYLANPGYLADSDRTVEGINRLGPLSHANVLLHVRASLCVFYPNLVFPETFGLVFAEANAVGTPVITHPIGAATEVLSHPYETVDCRNPKALIDRVMSWYDGGRPRVKANPKFRLSNVLKSWLRLFNVG